MDERELQSLVNRNPMLFDIAAGNEVVWINPDREPIDAVRGSQELGLSDIDDAERRLARFAPMIMSCFPETVNQQGMIESDLTPIPRMHALVNETYGAAVPGRMLLKQDSHLAIAGSVKARGGIYEVLEHTENLAVENGLLTEDEARGVVDAPDSYRRLADEASRTVFSNYVMEVGSTGNLGMSIGITSAVIGYRVKVHMSSDARQWKKDMLRRYGVEVVEYESDYSEAVRCARESAAANPMSHFVDDENSRTLFLGYSVAARRLPVQLRGLGVHVDEDHPLFVYLPCGVGGAPGGITFGLRHVFGDNVHCFFVEPTQAPCMLAGMVSGLGSMLSVQDLGLGGKTEADGLAVGRPSQFIGELMKPHLSGEVTVLDDRLYGYLHDLFAAERVFVEPSAAAAFHGPVMFGKDRGFVYYVERNGLTQLLGGSTHVVWATGGSMVPRTVREEYLRIGER